MPEVTDSSWGEVRREEARRTLLHLQTDCRGEREEERQSEEEIESTALIHVSDFS